MTGKITNEQIEEWEAQSLVDGLFDGSLELNDEFLEQYAGEDLRRALLSVPENDRAFLLDGHTGEPWFNGTIPSLDTDSFLLPCGEIETQFDGNAADVFETPDDLCIQGDLAYLYIGYGLSVPVDVAGLRAEIAEQRHAPRSSD